MQQGYATDTQNRTAVISIKFYSHQPIQYFYVSTCHIFVVLGLHIIPELWSEI